ncbi:MAG: hypothetical protein KUG78_10920, partial [Kangiellaceae bacterium]|nr:hypothetical protein [Kangiellaceae bacterium]
VDDESATLYKTGDKARFLDDGRVDFIGRIDDQVKIAGRRIEIEEIEARCKAFEDVVNAAVIVHSDEAGNKLLRAFVILREAKNAHADINNLKSYLSKYLPSYMLPIQYFLLKEFPSSINGKLDRKKLERIEHNYDTQLKEIKNSLNLQNIIIALKNIGNNIYLPICYFASKQNQVDSDEILGLLEQIVEPYQQPFTLFSLGFLPTLDTPKALVQLPIPTEYEMQWLNLRARPASKSQKILEKIWLRELNSNEVFLEDNFVECGGDSIKAVRIILELKNKTGVELTGADIFGSNFGYCAARLESEISGNPLVLSTPGKVDPPPPVSAFFFKNNSYDLYGVYHPPLEASIQQTAFLLCPAITNDYQRSRPLLQNLATKLCSAGFPSMRFDYFGCGDSEGESEEISIDECRSSILAAINQLKRQSGCNKIILFGLRFGATLVSELADSNHADFHGIVDRIVLFDPIRNGKEFLADQRSLHSSLLNDPNYFQWRKQVREFDDYEEILGQAFSHQFIDQLSELSCSINQQSDMNIAKNESLTKYRIDVIYSKNVEPFTLKSNDVKEQMYINHFQIEDECGWKAQDKIDSTIITNNLAQQVINCVQRKST